MIASAEHMDRAAARRVMEARRQDPQPWEEIVASNGYRIPKSTDANTAPFVVDGRRLGFVIIEPEGMRILHTETVAFFDVDVPDRSEQAYTLRLLHNFVGENPEYGFRVYRTAGGFRYLCSSHLFSADEETAEIMKRLHCDRNYVALCMASGYFAARLSPKPARRRRDRDYAVTTYQFTTGNPVVIPDCLTVLKFHDKETGAFTDLPRA